MGVGPLVLYAFTAVSPLVIGDLGLTPTQYGAVSTIAFASAAATALLLGRRTSRVEAGTLMVAVSLGAALGILLLAVATSYVVVVTAAVVAGAAQALSNPATNRIVAGLEPGRRGALIGWKQSGVQMSQLAAGLLAPSLAVLAGWRVAVACCLLVAVIGVLSARRVRRAVVVRTPGPEGDTGTVSVPMLTAYTFFMGFGLQATNAYTPLFAHQRLGFGVRTAGLAAAMIGVVGLASRIWWGRRSDRQELAPSTFTVLALGSAAGVALVLSAVRAGPWAVWLGAGVFGAAALASNSVTMSALIRSVPPARLGAATALLVTGLYLGFATGPLAFGLVLDHTLSFELAWLLPLAAFAVAAVLGCLTGQSRPQLKGTPC
ncbi:MFS transporter [Nocardia sp. NPDC050799]|uniref:MFS transporter n=1 Tax=Nocardia sp. NPDC050799 TaxID=3154842 RepID=UPI0033ED6EE7